MADAAIVDSRVSGLLQFARFVKPGSVRLGTSANSRADVLISAYNYNGKKIIVAINTGIYTANQKITVQDATISEVMPYLTTELKNAEQGTKIMVPGNSFTYLLPSNSITTFVEQ